VFICSHFIHNLYDKQLTKKNLSSEQVNQTTTSEGLPANLTPSQTMQQSWNPQIPANPQPQEINLTHNVAHLDQEFADL